MVYIDITRIFKWGRDSVPVSKQGTVFALKKGVASVLRVKMDANTMFFLYMCKLDKGMHIHFPFTPRPFFDTGSAPLRNYPPTQKFNCMHWDVMDARFSWVAK